MTFELWDFDSANMIAWTTSADEAQVWADHLLAGDWDSDTGVLLWCDETNDILADVQETGVRIGPWR